MLTAGGKPPNIRIRGSSAGATKRINDWRILSMLQAKN
jgi:hypothetical protein